jgi:hypothetical protein
MVEEDKDESPHVNTDETDEEAQDTRLAFDDDLDSEDNDFTIEEDDRIFMMMVHLVDPHHFVHASSMVSGRLAEVFAKNSNLKGFEDIVLMAIVAANSRWVERTKVEGSEKKKERLEREKT